MANDPTGQVILEDLKVSEKQLKEVEGSIASIKVSSIKPS
jgi:hypothetical protein